MHATLALGRTAATAVHTSYQAALWYTMPDAGPSVTRELHSIANFATWPTDPGDNTTNRTSSTALGLIQAVDRRARRKSTRNQATQTRMLTLRPACSITTIMPTNYLPQGFTTADDPFVNASAPAAISVEDDWQSVHYTDTYTMHRTELQSTP